MSEAPGLLGRPEGTAGRRNAYWLVEERGPVGPEVLVSKLADGRRMLPVFGFEEEAYLFVRLTHRDGRGVRHTGTDKLVSLLRGPLGAVELVALDPLSEAGADMLDASVGLSRQRFLDFLLRARLRTETPAPPTRSPVPFSQAQTRARNT